MSDQTPQDPQPTPPAQPYQPPAPTYLPPVTTEPWAFPMTPTAPTAPTAPAPKRRLGLVVGAIVLVLALAGGFFFVQAARSHDDAQARSLALSFSVGQAESYRIDMSMDGSISAPELGTQPLKMDIGETISWQVTAVDSDGVATVEVSIADLSGTINGVALPSTAPALPSIQMRIAPDGRILTAGGLSLGGAGDTNGFSFPGMGQFTPLLPDGPVAPGDTWDKTFSQKMPFGSGKIEYTTHSTFVGYEDVNGTNAAVIDTDLTVPLDFTVNFSDVLAELGDSGSSLQGASGLENASIAYGGQGKFSMKAWVDLDTNQMLKSESQGSFDMTMAFSGVPNLPAGAISFSGDFTQNVEKQ